jgi:hypothetical protein
MCQPLYSRFAKERDRAWVKPHIYKGYCEAATFLVALRYTPFHKQTACHYIEKVASGIYLFLHLLFRKGRTL